MYESLKAVFVSTEVIGYICFTIFSCLVQDEYFGFMYVFDLLFYNVDTSHENTDNKRLILIHCFFLASWM